MQAKRLVRLVSHLLVLTAMFATAAMARERSLHVNGRALDASALARIEALEWNLGVRLPDGRYWYDERSGAFGRFGGPTETFLPAGLSLGGPMPANCSGGGTRVFINGRELHPRDVEFLRRFTPVNPGRYWLLADGTVGREGGGALGNLRSLVSSSSGGAHSWKSDYGYGGEDGNGFGYVVIPGTSGVMYGE